MIKAIANNVKYEVKTPTGWANFSGIKKVNRVGGLEIKAKDQSGNLFKLICSKGHRLKLANNCFRLADETQIGELLANGKEVVSVIKLAEEFKEYFDLLDVADEEEYITNDLVSHNCAHIPESTVTELWLSVYPTLSTGGSAILISTPNGTENLFYRIWAEAREGKNAFVTMELPWTVHPERDQKWYDQDSAIVRAAKGERGVLQEFHCVFIGSGDTFINADVLAQIEQKCLTPIEQHSFHRQITVWKRPEEGHKYIVTSDVASGSADDYTTFVVVDLNTGEAVADFQEKIPPQEFAPLIMQIGYEYNTAVICPEMNSYGLIVSEALRKEKYPKLYFDKMNSVLEVEGYEADQFEMPGWKTHEGSRPDMLAKLDYMLSTGKLKINSLRFLTELKHFVWKNNKPQAAKGKHDDLVIAYAIAAKLLSTIDEEILSETSNLLKTEELLSMIGGLTVKTSNIDLSSGKIIFNKDENLNSEQNDPTKVWNWIF